MVYNDMWSNFCVSYALSLVLPSNRLPYPPALETGSINPDDTFYCDGYEFITDTRINCDNVNGHGMETVREAIQNSCNDALMQIGYRLGVEKFCKYQRLFNFGSRTGIDLPNENIGSLYTTENMHEGGTGHQYSWSGFYQYDDPGDCRFQCGSQRWLLLISPIW